jgi:hypothetical protein
MFFAPPRVVLIYIECPHTYTDALGELETSANEFADFVKQLSDSNEPQDSGSSGAPATPAACAARRLYAAERLRVDAPNVIAYLFELQHGFVK